jgi:hypothetical protein
MINILPGLIFRFKRELNFRTFFNKAQISLKEKNRKSVFFIGLLQKKSKAKSKI